MCSGTCVNLQTDLAHCGQCGTQCKAGEVCTAGKCALSCQSGLSVCSNTCVNLKTDLAHCGACGTKCNSGEVCSAGKCALSCQAGLSVCNNTCVNLKTDNNNCGTCGSKCSYGTTCSAGSCQVSCGNSTLDPGEQCDGSVPASVNCSQLGYSGGTVGCSAKCTFDTSKCSGGDPAKNIANTAQASSSGGGIGSHGTTQLNNGALQSTCTFHWILAGSSLGGGKWVQYTWSGPVTVGQVWFDTSPLSATGCSGVGSGRTLAGGHVQVMTGGVWQTVATVTGKTDDWSVSFTPVTTTQLRLFDAHATSVMGQKSNPAIFEWRVWPK